ncbi:unnamed protein product [Somion occarium]|uniref:DUF2855 family protein n=1 Tax=Somion occarium TaxID=3059160 RepID=A0ABP1CYN6_9APHY
MSGATESNVSLCVARPSSGQDPHVPVIVRSPKPTLPKDHILVKVDRFGFSANNVTYQALGEAPHFKYFDFHPGPEAEGVSPKTHGLVPVWGFGTIIASTNDKLRAGERIYGYLAPTRYLLLPVVSSNINKYFFYIPRPHLPEDRRPYNQIIRCASDPQYDPAPAAEDLTMLYRPLFWTSFWCEDWLYASSYRGAKRIVISSASSKTAFCLAYCVKKRIEKAGLTGIRIVGLTSKRNLEFTKGLGLYDEVGQYDGFENHPALQLDGQKWLYLDVTGNEDFNKRVLAYFAPSKDLVLGIRFGMTTLSPSSSPAASTELPTSSTAQELTADSLSPDSLVLFFMPEWLAIRRKQLSVQGITKMQLEAWRELMKDGRNWVRIQRVYGGENVKKAYEKIVKGELGPDVGMVWSLWDAPEAVNSKL